MRHGSDHAFSVFSHDGQDCDGDFGVVRGRFARVNGCSVGLYSRPGECLVCQSTPWTRYMHVETVSDGEYGVRIHSLSENDARGVRRPRKTRRG